MVPPEDEDPLTQMKHTPRIWVDFMKTDDSRRIALTTFGTRQDLTKYGIALREGMVLHVYSDDVDENGRPDNLLAEGVVHFDAVRKRWVLAIDWNRLVHESDSPPATRSDVE